MSPWSPGRCRLEPHRARSDGSRVRGEVMSAGTVTVDADLFLKLLDELAELERR